MQSDVIYVKLDAFLKHFIATLGSFAGKEFTLYLPPLGSAFVAFH